MGKDGFARTFLVYEGLLKYYSSYFRDALSEERVDGQTKTINLAEDNSGTFRDFFYWLSSGKLYEHFLPGGQIPFDVDRICEIFYFGDKRGIPELCNAAIDLLFQKLMQAQQYPLFNVKAIYHNTTPQSPLRRYIVGFGAEHHIWTNMRDFMHACPKDFLADIIIHLAERDAPPSYLQYILLEDYIKQKESQICPKFHDHSAIQVSASAPL